MSKKYLATAVLTRRSTKKIVRNAAGFCKKFRFHRFAMLASDAEEAREIVTDYASSGAFAKKYKTDGARVCLSIMFPTGNDMRPVRRRNLFTHNAVVRVGPGDTAANYRTVVSATSAEMAEWKAMESHLSRSVAGMKRRPNGGLLECESYVVPCPADLVDLGQSNLTEAIALFRKTYFELAAEADAESGGVPLDLKNYENTGELLSELSDETKICLPDEPTPHEIARAWILEQSGNSSARRMSDGSEEGEHLLASFLARLCTKLFITESHSCIGAGVQEVTDKTIAKIVRAAAFTDIKASDGDNA